VESLNEAFNKFFGKGKVLSKRYSENDTKVLERYIKVGSVKKDVGEESVEDVAERVGREV
jgi:hypothetical protein